jgi:hypothetical protein
VFLLPTAWTIAFNLEATRDWKAEQWNIPAAPGDSKVIRVGRQMMSIQAGPATTSSPRPTDRRAGDSAPR